MATKRETPDAPAAAPAEVSSGTPPGMQVAEYDAGNGIIGRAVFGGIEDLALSLWSSMPISRRGDIIRLIQGQTDKVGDHIGETIVVEHILAHRVEMVDKDGVAQEGDRIVLVTPDGRSYAAVSVGLRKSLSLIMALYGTPPWKNGLKLQIKQINTRMGFRTYTLEPVEDAK